MMSEMVAHPAFTYIRFELSAHWSSSALNIDERTERKQRAENRHGTINQNRKYSSTCCTVQLYGFIHININSKNRGMHRFLLRYY